MGTKANAQSVEAALIPDALLTVETVAQIVGVKPRTVWEWAQEARDGFPKPKRYGRKLTRWRAGDVMEWLRLRQAAGGTP